MIRQGQFSLPSLGVKQQLVLDCDLWAATHRLLEVLPCTIQWTLVKGHQTKGKGIKWVLDIEINNFCDKKAEQGRFALQPRDLDPFFLDQKCGIILPGPKMWHQIRGVTPPWGVSRGHTARSPCWGSPGLYFQLSHVVY